MRRSPIKTLSLIIGVALIITFVILFLVWWIDDDRGRFPDELKGTDAVLVTDNSTDLNCLYINNSEKVDSLLKSIRLTNSDPGACGYSRHLYFIQKGHLIEEGVVNENCHVNFVTGFGYFHFNRSFRKAIKAAIEDKKNDRYLYNFFLPADISDEEAVNLLRELGFNCLFLGKYSGRYPRVELEYRLTAPMPENKADKADDLLKQRAINFLADTLRMLKSRNLLHHSSETKILESSFGAGSISHTASVRIYFNYGVTEDEIRRCIPREITIKAITVPEQYPVQVVVKEKLNDKDIASIIQKTPTIKRIEAHNGSTGIY